MTRSIFLCCIAVTLGLHRASGQPVNDDFENRLALTGDSFSTDANNSNATRQFGEPIIEGNAGGKSLWWTWTAPQNGSVTIRTEGSDFDTLLGVFTGDSLADLNLTASNDDTLGMAPLTSLVTFHSPSGAVHQIVVDGYRGDDGVIASGHIRLSLDFVYDRYTVGLTVNDTNRGAIRLDPTPDPDGRYLVGTDVTFIAEPQPGWYFDSWSGDLAGTNSPLTVTLSSNLNVTANFDPILIRTVQRSPSSFTKYAAEMPGSEWTSFKVWNSEVGTLNYKITTDASWLSVPQDEGTSRGETNVHQLYINSAALRHGAYVGTILISPLVEGAQPQSIVVAVRIDPNPIPTSLTN